MLSGNNKTMTSFLDTCSYDAPCGYALSCDVRAQFCREGACYMCSGSCSPDRILSNLDHSYCMKICGVYMERNYCQPPTTASTEQTDVESSTSSDQLDHVDVAVWSMLVAIIVLLIIILICVVFYFRGVIRQLNSKLHATNQEALSLKAHSTNHAANGPTNPTDHAQNGPTNPINHAPIPPLNGSTSHSIAAVHLNQSQNTAISLNIRSETVPLLQQDGVNVGGTEWESGGLNSNIRAQQHGGVRQARSWTCGPSDSPLDARTAATSSTGEDQDSALSPTQVQTITKKVASNFASDSEETVPKEYSSMLHVQETVPQSDSAASSTRELNLTEHDYPTDIYREDMPTNVGQQPVSSANISNGTSPGNQPVSGENGTNGVRPGNQPISGANVGIGPRNQPISGANATSGVDPGNQPISDAAPITTTILGNPIHQPTSANGTDIHPGNEIASALAQNRQHDDKLVVQPKMMASSMQHHEGSKFTIGAAKNDSGIDTAEGLSPL